MISSGRQDMTAAPTRDAVEQLRLRYALGASTADAYHTAGIGVVVQDVVLSAHLREYVVSIRSRPLVVVVLAPSPRVVAEPERGRATTAYRDAFSTIIDL